MLKIINSLTGLSLQITESIKAEIKRFPEVRAAYLFGHAPGVILGINQTSTSP